MVTRLMSRLYRCFVYVMQNRCTLTAHVQYKAVYNSAASAAILSAV